VFERVKEARGRKKQKRERTKGKRRWKRIYVRELTDWQKFDEL
jgi:hypothetical protein